MPEIARVPVFFRILHFSTIDSTSEEAKRLSVAGATEGTLVWASQQTAGHGRSGRSWISPRGNLYFSLLLRPELPPQETMQLTFVAALAAAEAIFQTIPAGTAVTCKWPNDVLVSGKKVAGILLESSLDGGGRVDSLVIGIGVNIASHPPVQQVHYPATSLWAEGARTETAQSMLERFCPSFLAWLGEWREHGFSPVREAWRACADSLHCPIKVQLDGDTMVGIFADLDSRGALVLQQERERRVIFAGDVFPASE
jgi:BirA family biotin operon repressor/biotin-[acetyl-CoA-carboxylase] ligase